MEMECFQNRIGLPRAQTQHGFVYQVQRETSLDRFAVSIPGYYVKGDCLAGQRLAHAGRQFYLQQLCGWFDTQFNVANLVSCDWFVCVGPLDNND